MRGWNPRSSPLKSGKLRWAPAGGSGDGPSREVALKAKRWTTRVRRLSANPFAWAILFAVSFSAIHVAFLPLSISYDGLVFLDLADILGSERFPRDWEVWRTPLFPLFLKVWLAAFGRSPHTLLAGLALLGLGVALTLGITARRFAGDAAAALVVVLVSAHPTFICYQHTVLSEVGSSLFLALFVCVLVVSSTRPWLKTLTLAALLGAGYYWRQPLLSLAPIVAVLYGLLRLRWEAKCRSGGRLAAVVAQVLVLAILPFQLTRPWRGYTDSEGLAEVALRQGLLRQALLPSNHEVLGTHAAEYVRAVQESSENGNFLSGLRSEQVSYFYEKLFRAGTADRTGSNLFLQCVWTNPLRYLAGVGRTLALMAGARGAESRNADLRLRILDDVPLDHRLAPGPTRLVQRMRREFGAPARESLLMRLLRPIAPVFDRAVLAGSILSAIGVVAAICWRDAVLLALCAVPWAYFLPFGLSLASIDRYGFPAHPLLLANLVLIPWLVIRRLGNGAKAPPPSRGARQAAHGEAGRSA